MNRKNATMLLGVALIAGGLGWQYQEPITSYAGQAVEWVTGSEVVQPEVVVVDESGTRPHAVAAIYLSKAVADAAKGCKLYRWVDPGSSGPSIADVQWAKDAAAVSKVPERCVVIRRGTRITIVAMPATPDAMIALLHKYGA